jgi:hypothetical protein
VSEFDVLGFVLILPTGEVAALQQAGYYGDGFWSAGQVLRDGAQERGPEEDEEDAPEYLVRLHPKGARV